MSNTINQGGYSPNLYYFGQEDNDVELLINKINEIDNRYFFSMILYDISFTGEKAKELMKLIETRKIEFISLDRLFIGKKEVKVLLDYLHSPSATYFGFIVNFSNIEDVTEALRAIKSKKFIKRVEIMTEELASKEAEELTMEILDTHLGCNIYLNSKLKALKIIKEKGVQKYLW